MSALDRNTKWKGRKGPLVLVIMDGVGYGKYKEGDAVADAKMYNLIKLTNTCPHTKLKAHGTAVGLPSDEDMGNSEVGHNAIGCGRVFAQGAKLVSQSIASGAMFQGQVWKKITERLSAKGTLHCLGLFSDGNVHSNIEHLKAILERAQKDGIRRARVHILLDGRDVGEQSALEYLKPFEEFLKAQNAKGCDFRVASGGGRQYITMDRYNANWEMVEKGWNTHVHGKGRQFATAEEAISTYRIEKPGIIDQDLPEFVIAENGKPVGTVEDGDALIYFNFRGDRALEITAAFEQDNFDKFDRGRRPEVLYAGMMEYDGDLHVPAYYLVNPPSIDRTVGEFLAASEVRMLAISETQKFGHVTYFYNGNRTGKFNEAYEDYVEVPSDRVPFEQRPWMKTAEITDTVLDAVLSGKYDFIRLNYPNGDMVGHTGNYQAVVCALEGMDIQLGRLREAVEKAGGIMILTADHGNADDMFEHSKKTGEVEFKGEGIPKAKTSHSLNPVPCVIYDPACKGEYERALKEGLGISSLAATCIELLGFVAPADYDQSVLAWKNS